MTRALVELRSAVEDELGEASSIFRASFINRAINEGQRRYIPDVCRYVVANVNIASSSNQYDLPDDFVRLGKFYANTLSDPLEPFELHGATMIFRDRTAAAFSGRLAYCASWPAVTDEQDCILPDVAADGLISYALYRCYKRIASNRVDYRTYSTMVGNQASVADVEAMAQTYLDDWQAAGESAVVLPEPSQ